MLYSLVLRRVYLLPVCYKENASFLSLILSLPSLLSFLHLWTKISVCADSSCPDREALTHSYMSCQSVRLNCYQGSQEPHSQKSQQQEMDKSRSSKKDQYDSMQWEKNQREANPKSMCACLLLFGQWSCRLRHSLVPLQECHRTAVRVAEAKGWRGLPQTWTRAGAGWSGWGHLISQSFGFRISDSKAGRLDGQQQQMYSVFCTQF